MNKILKTKYTVLGISVLLIAILAFAAFTAKPQTIDNANIQVSRIDFKSDINPTEAKEICKDLRTIKGLTSDSIIVKRNSVVYFANNTVTNSEQVYNQLMRKGSYDAERFIVLANNSNKEVCPMNKDGIPYKISMKLIQFFNKS